MNIDFETYEDHSTEIMKISPCDAKVDLSFPFELCVCHEWTNGETKTCTQNRLVWKENDNFGLM